MGGSLLPKVWVVIPERAVSGYLRPEDTSPGPRRLGAARLGKLGSSGPLGRPWVSIWAPLMEPGPSQPLPRHPAIAAPSCARGAVLVPGGGRQWPEGGTECSAPGWRQKPIIAPAKEDQFVPSQPCPLGRVSSCTVSREGPRSLGPLGPWVWASPERGLHLRSRTVLHPLQAALSLALSTDSPCPARGTSCWAVTLESLPECRWQPCCTYASRAGDPGSLGTRGSQVVAWGRPGRDPQGWAAQSPSCLSTPEVPTPWLMAGRGGRCGEQ